MANIYETIYPKFKNDFSFAELNEIYTPTDIGVPSGKCGFTTLRNFPDFLI